MQYLKINIKYFQSKSIKMASESVESKLKRLKISIKLLVNLMESKENWEKEDYMLNRFSQNLF